MHNTKHTGMLVTITGGQLGSEGKGQIARLMAERMEAGIAVRVGGPNAGHSFYPYGPTEPREVVQVIPVATSYMPKDWTAVIGAAGIIDPVAMFSELRECLAKRKAMPRTIFDHGVVVITDKHKEQEALLKGSIGSTGKGVGAATADKVMRNPGIVMGNHHVRDNLAVRAIASEGVMGTTHGDWQLLVEDTVVLLNTSLAQGTNIMVEGTQGYGLSLHTGGYYPFCTSRECTPAGLISQTGINPKLAESVEHIMVFRTFPIRVGGNSGPMTDEISWEELREETGGYVDTPEITTVTKKVRRIARFDWDMAKRAVQQCGPDSIALTFLDYVFPKDAGKGPGDLSQDAIEYIKNMETRLGVPIRYISTGPGATFALEA